MTSVLVHRWAIFSSNAALEDLPPAESAGPGRLCFIEPRCYFIESDEARGLLVCEHTSGTNQSSGPSEHHIETMTQSKDA